MSANLSSVIIASNEAENLRRCLPQLARISDDVVVVDACSTDETDSVCREMGVRLIKRKWQGYSSAKNFGNSLAAHDWIISTDADEILSNQLVQSISAIRPTLGFVYALDRITSFCGVWIRHSGWYPDWNIRIFNRNNSRWEGKHVHERLVIPQNTRVVRLEGKLFHYSYKTHEDYVKRRELYAELSARDLYDRGVRLSISRRRIHPTLRFLRTYLLKRGFLDGRNGLVISLGEAQMIRTRYRKLAELRRGARIR